MLQLDSWITPTAMPTPPGDGEIHIWKIEVIKPETILSHLLSHDEQRRCKKLLHKSDQIRFSNARGHMRAILAGYLGLSPNIIQFRYGTKGKPVLNPSTRLQFNLSHAGDLALLAVSTGLPIGIDIEQLRGRNNLRRIAQRVFEPDQWQAMEPLDEKQFINIFYTHWTQLEARVKACGEGVFSHADRHNQKVSCTNFQPQANWCAALAAVGHLPEPTTWTTLRPSPELIAEIG